MCEITNAWFASDITLLFCFFNFVNCVNTLTRSCRASVLKQGLSAVRRAWLGGGSLYVQVKVVSWKDLNTQSRLIWKKHGDKVKVRDVFYCVGAFSV